MKRFLSIVLVVIFSVSCLAFTSCGLFGGSNKDVAGVYEMVEVSGTVTYGGTTYPLSEDLYEYYTITLNEDGTAIIDAKGNGSSAIREEAKWEYDEPDLEIISNRGGFNVVEKMQLKDGVITYDMPAQYDSLTGMTIEMNLVLEKTGGESASVIGILFGKFFELIGF